VIAARRLLAVVPARSGSKGIPNKNMQPLNGISLIGHAGLCAQQVDGLDARLISTDSPAYAAEGSRYGLEAPFLRPAAISGDGARATEMLIHALESADAHYRTKFDIVVLLEPTSPLRRAEDVAATIRIAVATGADSVVTVSPIDARSHPGRALAIHNGRISYYEARGRDIANRQELEPLYARNGVCYALTRDCILRRKAVITDDSRALVIARPVVSIDTPIDMEWATFLMQRLGMN